MFFLKICFLGVLHDGETKGGNLNQLVALGVPWAVVGKTHIFQEKHSLWFFFGKNYVSLLLLRNLKNLCRPGCHMSGKLSKTLEKGSNLFCVETLAVTSHGYNKTHS